MALLENLLFWIKSQMQGEALKPEEIDLRTLLAEVIDEQEVSALGKGITILNEVEPGMRVTGDLEMLKVIFRNLLSNSIKFTRNEGTVVVSGCADAAVQVRITDQGIGITEAALRKIKRKQYFTTAGTNQETGSGFGLMICDELVNRHGGALSVESTLGEGTSFTVKLPAPEPALVLQPI